MFGSSKVSKETVLDNITEPTKTGLTSDEYNVGQNSGLIDSATKLRKEAAALEVAMREEARAKGLPEEVINKLIPLNGRSVRAAADGDTVTVTKVVQKMSAENIRKKLGYLNTGDAIRFVSELDRIKSKDIITLWNSRDLSKEKYQASNAQLKSKTNIDAAKLKLDDVGFDYQKVFGTVLITATVLALASSFVGGQIGFLLGYASALIPIVLVGIGSIAPALIGDIVNRVQYELNAEAKDKYITGNAAKFLVGYISGLPMGRFSTGGPSNTVQFYQLRPSGKSEAEDKKMFASRRFSQSDISRCAVTCVAAPTAECMAYGEASGANGADINILYESLNALDPVLVQDQSQNYIRWSIITAHDILKKYQPELAKLKIAFAEGLPLEECIACIEGEEVKELAKVEL